MYDAVLLTTAVLDSNPKIIPSIAHLHASCILIDHTVATYLPPLNSTTLTTFWTDRFAESTRDERAIIVVLADPTDHTINPSLTLTGDTSIDTLPSDVCGVVILSTPFSQTGPFRAIVEKLFVSPSHRRLGLGRKLMKRLEEVALERERTMLILDTTVGTPAEKVYPRLGYRRVGVIERYGISPEDGRLVDEVLFWKDLNVHERL